jgi:L-erythro-3,5-diaminohexanoate dehydrogenase
MADATSPLSVYEQVIEQTGGVDVAFGCTNVAGAEAAAFLPTRDGGTVVLYSMSTSFVRAALGAESVGKDVTLVIGNGWVPGHAAYALDLVRRHPVLQQLLLT